MDKIHITKNAHSDLLFVVPNERSTMQPRGIHTSEFWLHGLLQIILLLNTISVWSYMPQKYTVLVQGILGAAYAGSRGLAKVGMPPPVDSTVTAAGGGGVAPIEPPGDTTE